MRPEQILRIGVAVLLSLILVGLLVGMTLFHPQRQIPVYPGIQGFGTNTPGGRGGEIIKVTTLADSGKGSLREALEKGGRRIVVFEVGGTITLERDLKVSHPFISLAGQTAPYPGILLRGAGIVVATHDVLIQHLRIRCGDDLGGQHPGNRDALKIVSPAENVVIDHVSASWATDENMSIWAKLDGSVVRNVTVRNSIISEGLNNSIHPEGAHSKGFLVGNNIENLSLIGNLFAHNKTRNPLVYGNVSLVAANNVFYNTGSSSFLHIGDGWHQGPSRATIVGNVFIAGPDTPKRTCAVKIGEDTPESKVFLSGNRYAGRLLCHTATFEPEISAPAVLLRPLHVLHGDYAEERVLSRAGARRADRDKVDERVVREVRTRTGRVIDSPKQVGGWPELENSFRPFPVPADADRVDDSDGYTRIEKVLHRMAFQVESGGPATQRGAVTAEVIEGL